MRGMAWLGFIALLGGFLLILFWQNNSLGTAERAAQTAGWPSGAMADPLDAARSGLKASQAYLAECRQARTVFKAGFLLFIALPLAVVFPVVFSGEEPRAGRAPTSKKVVNIQTMTLDDIDRGVPQESMQMSPQTRLLVWNCGAFLAAAGAFGLFPILRPEAYLRGGDFAGGAVRTVLLFLASALMVFSGSALAYPLRERFGATRAVAVRLGGGFAVLGGLMLAFL